MCRNADRRTSTYRRARHGIFFAGTGESSYRATAARRGGEEWLTALRKKNARYIFTPSIPYRYAPTALRRTAEHLNFLCSCAFSPFVQGTCKKKNVLRKERRRDALTDATHPPARHPLPTPVISSCTKLVKIPPVCPSLQPAQCGNHLTGWTARGLKEQGGEYRGAAARSLPVAAFSSLDGRDTAREAVCRPSAARWNEKLFVHVQ